MNSKRVSSLLPSGFILFLLPLVYLVPVISASSICGCIEMEKLKSIKDKSSITWNGLHDANTHDKCDLFCGSKMSNRFVQVDNGKCHCFNDTQLPTFDCDEVESTSSAALTVLNVYCVHARFNVHQAQVLHAGIFESPFKTLRSSRTNNEDIIGIHEDESAKRKVASRIAPAAILLALISIAVLILLACKTWCDHQKDANKDSEENLEDAKEKDASKNVSPGFIWKFDEHTVKETRGEHYI